MMSSKVNEIPRSPLGRPILVTKPTTLCHELLHNLDDRANLINVRIWMGRRIWVSLSVFAHIFLKLSQLTCSLYHKTLITTSDDCLRLGGNKKEVEREKQKGEINRTI